MLRQPVGQLIMLCQRQLHRTLCVVTGFRPPEDQEALYRKGRSVDPTSGLLVVTDPSQVVTKARPGMSAHNVTTEMGDPFAMAVDLVPMNEDGTLDWSPNEDFWELLYGLGWRCGLDALGDPVGAYLSWDKCHFEEPAWKLKLPGLRAVQPGAVGGVAL